MLEARCVFWGQKVRSRISVHNMRARCGRASDLPGGLYGHCVAQFPSHCAAFVAGLATTDRQGLLDQDVRVQHYALQLQASVLPHQHTLGAAAC